MNEWLEQRRVKLSEFIQCRNGNEACCVKKKQCHSWKAEFRAETLYNQMFFSPKKTTLFASKQSNKPSRSDREHKWSYEKILFSVALKLMEGWWRCAVMEGWMEECIIGSVVVWGWLRCSAHRSDESPWTTKYSVCMCVCLCVCVWCTWFKCQ